MKLVILGLIGCVLVYGVYHRIKNYFFYRFPFRKSLLKAYPHVIKYIKKNLLFWEDDSFMLIYEGEQKNTMLDFFNKADIADQFLVKYPLVLNGRRQAVRGLGAGKIRSEEFFKKMYGRTADEVKMNLEKVIWLPGISEQEIFVTRINRVHEKVNEISEEIARLTEKEVKICQRIIRHFEWIEKIEDDFLNPHSFGIALDFELKRRANLPKKEGKLDIMPMSIVQIFEKHGFIWGGKWANPHPEHFEYRPEILEFSGLNVK